MPIDPTAPAGINPLLWLIIFLLIGPPMLLAKTAAKIPGFVGTLARWWRNRQPEVQADVKLSEAWQRQDREIKRLSSAYDSISEDYTELAGRVDELDRKLSEVTRRFFAALGHIRVLAAIIRRIDPQHEIPDPPTELREYL